MYSIVNLDPWKVLWSGPDISHIISGVIYDSGLHYVSTTYIESVVLLEGSFNVLGKNYKSCPIKHGYRLFKEMPINTITYQSHTASRILDQIIQRSLQLSIEQRPTLQDIKEGFIFTDISGLRFKITEEL